MSNQSEEAGRKAATALGVGTFILTKNKAMTAGAALGAGIATLKNGDPIDLIVYSVAGGIMGRIISEKPDALHGAYCNPCMKHKNFGLRFPIKQLEEAFPKIIFFPIKKQAEYADEVTREFVNDPEKIGLFKPISARGWNATSVGNLAYIALNSKNRLASEYAKGLLKLYLKYKNATL